jgi:hypothetical protein
VNRSSRTLVFRTVGLAVTLNALAGVIALLGSGSLGQTQERILLSVVTISLVSVVLLPPATAWERVRVQGLPMIPSASAACSISAGLIILGAIWSNPDDDSFVNVLGTLIVLGLGLAHICLLLMPREGNLRLLAAGLTALLCVEILMEIWVAPSGTNWRLLGITAILGLATSILVPVRQWATSAARRALSDSSAVRYCPYCGEPLQSVGESPQCGSCGTSFRVTATTT